MGCSSKITLLFRQILTLDFPKLLEELNAEKQILEKIAATESLEKIASDLEGLNFIPQI